MLTNRERTQKNNKTMKKKLKIFLLLLGVMVAIFAISYNNPLTNNLSQGHERARIETSNNSQKHLNKKTLTQRFSNQAMIELKRAGNVFVNRLLFSKI